MTSEVWRRKERRQTLSTKVATNYTVEMKGYAGCECETEERKTRQRRERQDKSRVEQTWKGMRERDSETVRDGKGCNGTDPDCHV